MTTAEKRYATRESTVTAMQWTGGDASFRAIKQWTDGRVRIANDDLYIQLNGKVERVEVGNFLVDVNGDLFNMTPQELAEDYARLADD